MSSLFRMFRKVNNNSSQSKLYKALSMSAMIGLFLIVGIVVVVITGGIKLSSGLFGFLVTLGIVCFGVLGSLPWVKYLERGEYKKTSIVFICLIATTCLLWIICLWIGVSMFNQGDNITNWAGKFNFIKITIIFSLQFMVASVVATNVVKYKKSILPLQIITYVSYAFIDFYFTFMLACLKFLPGQKIEFSKNVNVLFSSFMITAISIAIAFAILANAILKRLDAKKTSDIIKDVSTQFENFNNHNNTEAKNTQEKLEELNNLLENNLITKEEYDEKRKSIINNM